MATTGFTLAPMGIVTLDVAPAAGKIRVHKVWMAVDGGLVVQPEAAKANIESGVVYGLSNALFEAVTVKDGVATLEGRVNNGKARDKATKLAKKVKNVKNVVNHLKLPDEK